MRHFGMRSGSSVSFRESQSFRQWRLWISLAIPPLVLCLICVWQVVLGHSLGKHPMSNGGLIGLTVFLWLVYMRLVTVRLTTEVREREIVIRLRGLMRRVRIPISEIQSASMAVCDPLREFGGYGFRKGRVGKGYLANGNRGVRLEFKDKTRAFLGSQKPEALLSAIQTQIPKS